MSKALTGTVHVKYLQKFSGYNQKNYYHKKTILWLQYFYSLKAAYRGFRPLGALWSNVNNAGFKIVVFFGEEVNSLNTICQASIMCFGENYIFVCLQKFSIGAFNFTFLISTENYMLINTVFSFKLPIN